jgi:ABC-type nitrate/sulfonate/bicarbonate transport system substrate-binding protein
VPVLAAEIRSPGAMKIFAVSSITRELPFDAILVRSDASIDSLQDLEGTSIGVFPGSTATNLLKKFLEDLGIDVGGIAFLPIPPQSQLAALQEGSIAALHAYEPTTAIALSNGDIRMLYGSVYAGMLEPNPQGVAVVSSEFARNSPDMAASTIRALERAMDFMRENDAGSRTILSSRLGLPEAAADAMIFLYMVGHDDISTATLQSYADMLTGLGELPEDLDVSELIYMDD